MPVGRQKFFVVEQKSFDVVEEGRGIRVYENGRGFRKSIFLQKEDVEWFSKSLREFRWEKWRRLRRSSWRTLCLVLSSNKQGRFLVLLESKDGPKRSFNRLIFPEGARAEGWWQIMDVVHEVVGVELFSPRLAKRRRTIA